MISAHVKVREQAQWGVTEARARCEGAKNPGKFVGDKVWAHAHRARWRARPPGGVPTTDCAKPPLTTSDSTVRSGASGCSRGGGLRATGRAGGGGGGRAGVEPVQARTQVHPGVQEGPHQPPQVEQGHQVQQVVPGAALEGRDAAARCIGRPQQHLQSLQEALQWSTGSDRVQPGEGRNGRR